MSVESPHWQLLSMRERASLTTYKFLHDLHLGYELGWHRGEPVISSTAIITLETQVLLNASRANANFHLAVEAIRRTALDVNPHVLEKLAENTKIARELILDVTDYYGAGFRRLQESLNLGDTEVIFLERGKELYEVDREAPFYAEYYRTPVK